MHIDVISIFPDMLAEACKVGVLRQAVAANKLNIALWNPRVYSLNRHRRIDEKPYGGGPGMVMSPEPLAATIDRVRAKHSESQLIYLSPQGKRLDQKRVQQLAQQSNLILLAGRYEGVDERLIDSRVDYEISIGDYILAGGEFAALVLIEAIARLLPGVLGNKASAEQDSFSHGRLEYPQYTRPEKFEGHLVPAVLLTGNHQSIARWRLKQALGRTYVKRPDLFKQIDLSDHEQALLNEFKLEHTHD